ncbi:MAG TPA: GH92 family glycosyl hydrolase, partial [Pelobium sp.]|nr:GH92 family glycosyl hydrolase [Pelobium sp.]
MRLKFLIFILCLSNIVYAQQKDFIDYVNPLFVPLSDTTAKDTIIKQEKETENLTNVIPAVGVPFGMTQWTPQTQTSEEKGLAPYLYKNEKINGFRGTHWSKGYGKDYGSFTIMPISGNLKTNAQDYASAYSHKNEISAPNYYKVLLDDSQITAELTGLARSGMMRFTAGKDDDFYLLITPNSDQGKGFIQINASEKEIAGYNPVYQMTGKPAGFSGYFVIQFKKKPTNAGVYHGGQQLKELSITNKKDLGAFLKFDLKKGESLTLKIGTSFTSIANARENLASEIRTWDFEAIREDAGRIWNSALGQINIETDRTKYKNIFYTSLYRTMQQPRLFNDVDGTYPKFSREHENGINSGANYYDDFLLDDTYSSQLPLIELLQPRTAVEFANSIVLKGEESNWLPIFPGWSGDTKTMVGDHASVFLASVYTKNLYGVAYRKAYDLMRKNAFQSPNAQEYEDGKGRRSLRDYIKYGYIPRVNAVQDTSYRTKHLELTLAYAYADYAVATMAKRMNNFVDYQLLAKRA